MQCSQCQSENPPGAKFCVECAHPLARRCAACGADAPPRAKFCPECAAPLTTTSQAAAPAPRSYTPKHLADKILQSKAALEGERKQVTVLFADVKGSMELAEQLDPEEFSQIMSRFFRILSEGVERFEGFVDKFTGDGIMALFGAPIAHEDHAERACYAALHLQDELRRYADELRRTQGLSFSVRMGLNSGEVVVGTIGDDLRMDYTAQGHTVGLAARMEQLAEPGKSLLTEATAKLVAGYFAVRDLGPFTIKGVGQPLHVHELEGLGQLRTRLDVSRTRGFSKFVGRHEEMAALDAAIARAQAGHGQVVGVVAEAGTGKSRLCFELLERCRARGIAVYESRCAAHGKMIPFLPILDLFRAYYGVNERDSDQTAREKIAGRMLLLDETLREALPLVFDFMGVPDPDRPAPQMDPEARQRHLGAIIKHIMHARSRREPAVTLLEDLHWIDGSSDVVVTMLVEATAGTRSLLLVNFRPEYHAAWMQQSYYQQLPLLPLGEQAVTELLGELLGADASLNGLPERIRERTGGNPFFIEEVARSLIDERVLVGGVLTRPVTEIRIPATVQAVLAARIDRLAEDEKRILQTAAVIGKEFAEPVLRRVTSTVGEGGGPTDLAATLRALTQAEFLHEQALYPEVEYVFKHPLTQEVAYHSQLSTRRAITHGAAARAVAERYADSLDEHAALIAYHWESAGELLMAAQWYKRAAEWVTTSDVAATHRHWERVRDLAGAVPESPATLALGIAAHVELVNLGWRLGIDAEERGAVFAAGRKLAEQANDVRSLALMLSNYALGGGNTADQAFAYYTEATRLAAQTNDAELRAAVGCMLGPHANNGRLRDVLKLAEDVLDLAGADPHIGAAILHFNPVGWLFTLKGLVKSWMGRIGEVLQEFDRAAQLTNQYGESIDRFLFHWNRSHAACLTGEAALALDHARRAAELADKVGGHMLGSGVWATLGRALMLNDAWDEAVVVLDRALATTTRRLGMAFSAGSPQLAACYFEQGAVEKARLLVDETIAATRRTGAKLTELEAQLVCADILLRAEGASAGSAAECAIARAETLAQETGALIYLPRALVARSRLTGLQNDGAERDRYLAEAQRLCTEMGVPALAKQLAKELGALISAPAPRVTPSK